MTRPTIVRRAAIELDGEFVLPFEYDDIKRAIVDGKESDYVFITANDDGYGIIKMCDDGDYTEENGFHTVGEFIDGIAIVSYYDERLGEKFILAKLSEDEGLVVLGLPKYDSIERLSKGIYKVHEAGYYGILDDDGNRIISCSFKEIQYDVKEKTYYLK